MLPPDLQGYNTYTTRRPDPRADLHADDHLDRRGARAGHEGRLPVLRGEARRRRHARLRQEPTPSTRRSAQEVRLHRDARRLGRPARPTSRRRPMTRRRAPLGGRRPGGPAGPPRPGSARRFADGRRRRVLRRPARAHALPDRPRPRRRRGEGRRRTRASSSSGGDEVVLLADSRYTIQARREAPDARIVEVYGNLAARWPELLALARGAAGRGRGRLRPAGDLGSGSRRRPRTSSWSRSRAGSRRTAPRKEPAELERVAAACAVADRALATLLPEIRPGVTEHELALRLEWLMRTGGAEALAFDVACLAGPEAALPHGSPGERPVLDRRGPALRLRRAGRRLSQRHDADAVRRRAGGAGPRRSTSWSPGRRRPRSRRSRRPSAAGMALRADASADAIART